MAKSATTTDADANEKKSSKESMETSAGAGTAKSEKGEEKKFDEKSENSTKPKSESTAPKNLALTESKVATKQDEAENLKHRNP